MRPAIDMDALERLERSFSKAELREIHRVCGALQKALTASDRAFAAMGSPVEGNPHEISTFFVAVITPERLQRYLPDLIRVRDFWQQQWREAEGPKARIYGKAATAAECAVQIVEAYLRKVEPLMRQDAELLAKLEYTLAKLKERIQ